MFRCISQLPQPYNLEAIEILCSQASYAQGQIGREVKAGMEHMGMERIRIQIRDTSAAAGRFEQLLQGEIKRSLHKDIAVKISRSEVGPMLEITATAPDREQLAAAVAEAAAQYIIEAHEQAAVRDMIAREYGYDDPEELMAIEAYCWYNPDPAHEPGLTIGSRNREAVICEELKQYLRHESLLIVEGMLRFRLHRYMDQLREIVEYAIDEYTADKQYEEFISLLKYFVYIQEAKIPVAHLIHKNAHEFLLLDEQMKPIETKQLDQFVVEMIDKEINYEDMIVSTLITVSPQHVYIHTRHPELQVIQTIQQIFEDRAAVCTKCPRCEPLLGDFKRQDHYYR